jgi:hypothetical protein
MLTKLKYHAGPDVESSEHRYFIRAAYVTPSEGGLFKTYEITRPEASGDPPVTPPYQNDIDLQEQFAINTGESDKHITIRFLCGGGVEPITLGSMDDYQLKARFDIFDISEL